VPARPRFQMGGWRRQAISFALRVPARSAQPHERRRELPFLLVGGPFRLCPERGIGSALVPPTANLRRGAHANQSQPLHSLAPGESGCSGHPGLRHFNESPGPTTATGRGGSTWTSNGRPADLGHGSLQSSMLLLHARRELHLVAEGGDLDL